MVVELLCETESVAKTAEFKEMTKKVAEAALVVPAQEDGSLGE